MVSFLFICSLKQCVSLFQFENNPIPQEKRICILANLSHAVIQSQAINWSLISFANIDNNATGQIMSLEEFCLSNSVNLKKKKTF